MCKILRSRLYIIVNRFKDRGENMEDSNNYFWGHYMNDRRAAEVDLLERAQRELKQLISQEKQARREEHER